MRGMDHARLTEIRRDLHAHPELGYEEHRTAGVVSAVLTELGIPHETGVGVTGVVGRIRGTRGGRAVALRADMDALPMTEETGAPWASRNPGVMHACGHDGHVAMLLGAASTLSQDPPEHDVVLLFQPAEEGGAGARRLVRAGVFEGVEAVYGLHGWPGLPLGELTTRPGPMMASADSFTVTLRGSGGHAAQPHLARDPVVAAAHLVTAWQTLASRTAAPTEAVVLTVGKIVAGTAHNVIPDEAVLVGTLRTLSDESTLTMKAAFERILQGVATAFGVSASAAWMENSYPVTYNDPEVTARAVAATGAGFQAEPSMAGEDFSFYREAAPGCYLFLGVGATPGLHAATYDFPDEALPFGVAAHVALARGGVS